MTEPRPFDRRIDVGQKLFVGILSAVLTTIFLSVFGISVRATEINQMQDVRLTKVEYFVETQNRLNEKLEKILDSLRFEKKM